MSPQLLLSSLNLYATLSHHSTRSQNPFPISQYLSEHIFFITNRLSSFSSSATRVLSLPMISQCDRLTISCKLYLENHIIYYRIDFSLQHLKWSCLVLTPSWLGRILISDEMRCLHYYIKKLYFTC